VWLVFEMVMYTFVREEDEETEEECDCDCEDCEEE